MSDVRNRYVAPAVSETAFNCPHCGALAKQHWFGLHAEPFKKNGTASLMNPDKLKSLDLSIFAEDNEARDRFVKWAKKAAGGRPFLDRSQKYIDYDLENVFVSQCFNCDDLAIWIYDRLVWPIVGVAPLANTDLPPDIRADYDEASTILNLSPRGAAALLRLGLQKLCKHLGGKGDNINDDIAALVRKGLDVRIQQALDIVRVVGNNATHPGQIDLRDNRATAEKLFTLVNLITDAMITQPNHVAKLYDGLPDGARKAIEQRDKKKQ